jgi:UPF0755 protein
VKSKAVIIASLLTLAAIILLASYFLLFAPVNALASSDRFEVARGKTLVGIAGDLREQGFIRSPFGLRLAWKFSGIKQIRAGVYSLSPAMDAWDVARIFNADDGTLNVTIPEGYTVQQIAQALASKEVVTDPSDFVQLAVPAHIAAPAGFATPPADSSWEGYLFPDTYNLYPGTPINDIVRYMLENFANRIKPFDEEIHASGKSLHEIVILASLVEKEAKTEEDRKLVAGVIANRLAKNMRLDIDASTRYAVNNWDKSLTAAQLNDPSPYNTRRHVGLPPGPICNPGLAAIKAVLEPTPSEFLYYLTGTDGKTYYAKTNDEHNINKAKYLR